MNDESSANTETLRKRSADPAGDSGHGPYERESRGPLRIHIHGRTPRRRLDFWVVLDLLLRRWHWLVLGSVLFAGGFFLLGREVVKTKFTASAKEIGRASCRGR